MSLSWDSNNYAKNWECHYENISNNLDTKTLCDSNNYEKNLAIVSHDEILSHYYQTVIIMRKKSHYYEIVCHNYE